MESRRLRKVVLAVAAAGLVLVGVFALGGRVGGWRGEAGGADAGRHGAGLFAQGAAHAAPPGQPPVTDLKVDRLRDAFNQAAAEPRIILSLSPT